MKTLIFYVSMLFLSFVIIVSSVFYQRPSSEIVRYGNLCKIEDWMHCYKPRESAGFPLAYGFDTPGVTAEHVVWPVMEDELRLLPFIINTWFYFLMLIGSFKLLIKRT